MNAATGGDGPGEFDVWLRGLSEVNPPDVAFVIVSSPFNDGTRSSSDATPSLPGPLWEDCRRNAAGVRGPGRDSKRFPDSGGWGDAQFLNDAASAQSAPRGTDSSFGTKVCYQRNTIVKAKDHIFTGYPQGTGIAAAPAFQ
jgi:hypothetical protein